MEFKEITSRENSLIKLVSSLQKDAKFRKENSLFVLEGLRICDDAVQNGIQFDKLIVSTNAKSKFKTELDLFCKNANECFVLPDSLFKKISDTTSPQGILAVVKMNENNPKIDKNGRYIALENLADPSNLGVISRTAEALGVTGIILSDNSCDPYSPKVLRASMGTLLRMPLIIFNDFANDIKSSGLKSYSSVVDKTAKDINDISFQNGSVVIIGNEANGITEETKIASNEKITIKMSGRAESLNAAAAASITMWELVK